MHVRTVMIVGWTAFLAACVLEAAVFAVMDPGELLVAGAFAGFSRVGVYTVAFFAFWLGAAVCGGMTALLVSGLPED